MTAFLFLQKFEDGTPSPLPFAPLMERLTQAGTPGRGAGDVEITLPSGAMAALCTVIGNAEEGISCIAFERPRFDAALRELAWDCMERFGCAVFDDTLATVCTTMRDKAALPASMARACLAGVRQVSSAQQLWPEDFEIGQNGPARPALRYPNRNPNGPHLQMFDYAGPDGKELVLEIGMRAQACNPATLRVLRNVALRVDAALGANPDHAAVYRYHEHETSLLLLESAPLGEPAGRATIVSPPPDSPTPDGFVADRAVFASEEAQAAQFIEHARAKYAVELGLQAPDFAPLAALLDRAHAACREQRERSGEGAAFTSTAANAWARLAGAFLGHLVVQHIGAQWGYIARGQQRLLALRTHGGTTICPHHLVLDHLINGPADSVMQTVDVLLREEAGAAPRGEDVVCQVPLLCEQLRGLRPFASGSGLPFEHLLAREQLDFSLASLAHLDRYLAELAQRLGELTDEALTEAILGAGAYLGETIRSNAPDAGHWQWITYENAARREPGFAARRPRDMTLLAILDSPEQMAYPFAQADAAIMEGAAAPSMQAYARRLVAGESDNPPPPPPQAAPVRLPADEQEDAAQRAARNAAWSAQLRREEQERDSGSSAVGTALLVLTMLLLAYTAKSSLAAFSAEAASIGSGKRLLYQAWILAPCLLMAGFSLRTARRFLPQLALFFASVLLAMFSGGAYYINVAPEAGPADLTAFLWVPLAQCAWLGGCVLALRHYLPDD